MSVVVRIQFNNKTYSSLKPLPMGGTYRLICLKERLPSRGRFFFFRSLTYKIMEQITIIDTTPRKTLTQVTKDSAKELFETGVSIKILNDKTGNMRRANATREEVFEKNMFYFILK